METNCVTNGCTGSCCEKFTLPVTIADLQKMKAEYERVKNFRLYNPNQISSETELRKIMCENGFERFPTGEIEIDKLLEMLIPLGVTNIDPQHQQDIATYKEFDPVKHTADMVLDKTRGHNFISPDGKQILTNIFTCKHFDTTARICTNYENRPTLCKSFGDECAYKGCGFVEKLKKVEEELMLAGSDNTGYLAVQALDQVVIDEMLQEEHSNPGEIFDDNHKLIKEMQETI